MKKLVVLVVLALFVVVGARWKSFYTYSEWVWLVDIPAGQGGDTYEGDCMYTNYLLDSSGALTDWEVFNTSCTASMFPNTGHIYHDGVYIDHCLVWIESSPPADAGEQLVLEIMNCVIDAVGGNCNTFDQLSTTEFAIKENSECSTDPEVNCMDEDTEVGLWNVKSSVTSDYGAVKIRVHTDTDDPGGAGTQFFGAIMVKCYAQD